MQFQVEFIRNRRRQEPTQEFLGLFTSRRQMRRWLAQEDETGNKLCRSDRNQSDGNRLAVALIQKYAWFVRAHLSYRWNDWVKSSTNTNPEEACEMVRLLFYISPE